MAASGFEEVEHTADWALRAQGASLEELLENAARGMLSLIGAKPGEGEATTWRLEIQGADAESLLVAWLDELLYRMETQRVTFGGMRIHVGPDQRLAAEIEEWPLLRVGHPIKAVTYHNLAVEKTREGLTATVVFDV
ncbi:MAG TPA: archease [Anaerolineales bacterium]|nr:archease [Anaerolineales bacterium]